MIVIRIQEPCSRRREVVLLHSSLLLELRDLRLHRSARGGGPKERSGGYWSWSREWPATMPIAIPLGLDILVARKFQIRARGLLLGPEPKDIYLFSCLSIYQ